MCIIIDACCANDLGNSDLPQSKLILDWVKAGGKIVSGGKLEQELRDTSLQKLLAVWSSSGRLISIDPERVDAEMNKVEAESLKSNDIHVVALARISGAGAVVTRDKPLMHDLKRSGQVTSPCKIYPFPAEAVGNLSVQRGVLHRSGCK